MLTKNDLLILLADLQNKGIDTTAITKELVTSSNITPEVLKFIHDNKPLEVLNFYTKIRKSYNQKKSSLYKNIVKEDIDNPKDILTTLASLQLQILLYAKQLENSQMFLRHCRFNEISMCLLNYGKTSDLQPCLKLIQLVKADLKVLESIC